MDLLLNVILSLVTGISSYVHESIHMVKITEICTVYCLVVLKGGSILVSCKYT